MPGAHDRQRSATRRADHAARDPAAAFMSLIDCPKPPMPFSELMNFDDHNGALYRAYLALAQANEAERLLAVFERECEGNAAMIDLFLDEKAFYEFFTQKRFEALRTK